MLCQLANHALFTISPYTVKTSTTLNDLEARETRFCNAVSAAQHQFDHEHSWNGGNMLIVNLDHYRQQLWANFASKESMTMKSV